MLGNSTSDVSRLLDVFVWQEVQVIMRCAWWSNRECGSQRVVIFALATAGSGPAVELSV